MITVFGFRHHHHQAAPAPPSSPPRHHYRQRRSWPNGTTVAGLGNVLPEIANTAIAITHHHHFHAASIPRHPRYRQQHHRHHLPQLPSVISIIILRHQRRHHTCLHSVDQHLRLSPTSQQGSSPPRRSEISEFFLFEVEASISGSRTTSQVRGEGVIAGQSGKAK